MASSGGQGPPDFPLARNQSGPLVRGRDFAVLVLRLKPGRNSHQPAVQTTVADGGEQSGRSAVVPGSPATARERATSRRGPASRWWRSRRAGSERARRWPRSRWARPAGAGPGRAGGHGGERQTSSERSASPEGSRRDRSLVDWIAIRALEPPSVPYAREMPTASPRFAMSRKARSAVLTRPRLCDYNQSTVGSRRGTTRKRWAAASWTGVDTSMPVGRGRGADSG